MPGWIIAAASLSAGVTALLTWILWRANQKQLSRSAGGDAKRVRRAAATDDGGGD